MIQQIPKQPQQQTQQVHAYASKSRPIRNALELPTTLDIASGGCGGWVGIPRICTCLSPRSLLTSIPHRTIQNPGRTSIAIIEWGACLYLLKKRFDATVSDLSLSVADGYLALPLVPRAKLGHWNWQRQGVLNHQLPSGQW